MKVINISTTKPEQSSMSTESIPLIPALQGGVVVVAVVTQGFTVVPVETLEHRIIRVESL